jgi:predicted porin
MNKKLLAVALAGAVAVPGIVSADIAIYGKLEPTITVTDGDVSFGGGGSRLGFKSSKDMGNGNTVAGVYELGMDASSMTVATGNRLSQISFSGDWGSAKLGRVWSAVSSAGLWNHCVGILQACGLPGTQFRTSDSVGLSAGVGGLDLVGDLQFADGDVGRWTIGTSVDIGSLNVGASYSDAGADDYTMVSFSTSLGGIGIGGGYGTGGGSDGWALQSSFAGLNVQLEQVDDAQNATADYPIDLGGAKLYILGSGGDGDTTIGARVRYDL